MVGEHYAPHVPHSMGEEHYAPHVPSTLGAGRHVRAETSNHPREKGELYAQRL